jgi:hypothetical protein
MEVDSYLKCVLEDDVTTIHDLWNGHYNASPNKMDMSVRGMEEQECC